MENRDVQQEEKAGLRLGLMVFIGLMVLTVLEYAVTVYIYSVAALFIAMMLKAGLIVWYFMHVYRLWREENH